MIPITEMLNPWYNPLAPSDLAILPKQSTNPLNCLSFPEPTSAANLVLAKSKGYTKHKEEAPAAPPEAKFPKKNFTGSSLGSIEIKIGN